MKIRDVIAVMGDSTLSAFPWGTNVVAQVNAILGSTGLCISLQTRHGDLEGMLNALSDAMRTQMESLIITDLAAVTQTAPVAPVTASSAVADPPIGEASATPPAADAEAPTKSNRFLTVILLGSVLAVAMSLSMAYKSRNDHDPTAPETKGKFTLLYQQIIDTIQSAATGKPPQIPDQPLPPIPTEEPAKASTAPAKP